MGFLLWFHLYFISVLNKHLLNVVRLEGSVLLPLNLGFMALISILNSHFLCHYYINDFLSHQSDISCGMRPCLSLIHDYVLCLAWGSPSGSYNLMAETHHNRPVTQGDTCSISTGLWQVQVSPERELSHLPRGGKQSLRRVPWGSRYLIFFFFNFMSYLFVSFRLRKMLCGQTLEWRPIFPTSWCPYLGCFWGKSTELFWGCGMELGHSLFHIAPGPCKQPLRWLSSDLSLLRTKVCLD